MASIFGFLNRLLPFATPGTPLVQDLIHLLAICSLLYYAPQIQEAVRAKRVNTPGVAQDHDGEESLAAPVADDAERAQPVQENLDAGRNDMNQHAEHDAFGDQFDEPEPEVRLNDNRADEQPGPAREANASAQRNVGAKKIKALARRDQRRAYNEFVRSQREAQRARDAVGAEEREVGLAAERQRRKQVEGELEARKAKERELKRQREETTRQEDIRRTELTVSVVKEELESRRMCNLFDVARQVGDDVDEEWIEKVLKASGLVGRKGDAVTMITGTGWIVRLTADVMGRVYATAAELGLGDDTGRIGYDDLSALLEQVLR